MQFADVIAGVLEVDPSEVTDNAGPDTIATWTSLRHLQLVGALEDVYGVSFTYREIRGLRSIGELRQVLRTRGVIR